MAKTYNHLNHQERALIETQLRSGMKPAAIALGLKRARSTITREIRRNGWRVAHPNLRAGSANSDKGLSGGWRTLNNPRMRVAHPSAFFAEGWVTANLDRGTGCRILLSWRNLSVTSSADVFTF
jgi:hypothetical protein